MDEIGIVIWNGARNHYLDDALNATPTRQAPVPRDFQVRRTQEATMEPEAVVAPPRRSRGPAAASIRSRLFAVLTHEWQAVGELMAAAGIPSDRLSQSNAAQSMSSIWCHGQAEREFQRVTRLGPGHRRQYVYKLVRSTHGTQAEQ